MKEFAITIQGKSPLLMNKFTDAAQLAATLGTSSAVRANTETPQNMAESRLYTADDGTIGIPQPNLFRCIIDSGKFSKIGRVKVTTQKSSLIPACLEIDPLFIPLKHEQAWTVDSRPVRNPSTGGRFLAYRPCFPDWELSFTATLDTEMMGEVLFRDIVDNAGSKIGLGDFRPDTKGPFGKFLVTRWETVKG